jgi:hypothetical protein
MTYVCVVDSFHSDKKMKRDFTVQYFHPLADDDDVACMCATVCVSLHFCLSRLIGVVTFHIKPPKTSSPIAREESTHSLARSL